MGSGAEKNAEAAADREKKGNRNTEREKESRPTGNNAEAGLRILNAYATVGQETVKFLGGQRKKLLE